MKGSFQYSKVSQETKDKLFYDRQTTEVKYYFTKNQRGEKRHKSTLGIVEGIDA